MTFFDPKYKSYGKSHPRIKIALLIALYIYIRTIYTQYYYHSRGFTLDNYTYIYLQLFVSLAISLYFGAHMFSPFAKIRISHRSWDNMFFRKNFMTLSKTPNVVESMIDKLKRH